MSTLLKKLNENIYVSEVGYVMQIEMENEESRRKYWILRLNGVLVDKDEFRVELAKRHNLHLESMAYYMKHK
jgi:hypothetical protein